MAKRRESPSLALRPRLIDALVVAFETPAERQAVHRRAEAVESRFFGGVEDNRLGEADS
jgi:hypothetical protein